MEPACLATHEEVPSRPRDLPSLCVEVIQRLIRKVGFSRRVEQVAALDLRCTTAALYQYKWTRFRGWCDRQGVDPCKATIPQVTEVFLFLRQELGLSVPAVKGCWAALNHVFSLTGMDLAASSVVSWMFCNFERWCPPRETRHPDWNLSLVLR